MSLFHLAHVSSLSLNSPLFYCVTALTELCILIGVTLAVRWCMRSMRRYDAHKINNANTYVVEDVEQSDYVWSLQSERYQGWRAWVPHTASLPTCTPFWLCVLPTALTIFTCSNLLLLSLGETLYATRSMRLDLLWKIHFMMFVGLVYLYLPLAFILLYDVNRCQHLRWYSRVFYVCIVSSSTFFFTVVLPFSVGNKIFLLTTIDMALHHHLSRIGLLGVMVASAFAGFSVTQSLFHYILPLRVTRHYIQALKQEYMNLDSQVQKMKNDLHAFRDPCVATPFYARRVHHGTSRNATSHHSPHAMATQDRLRLLEITQSQLRRELVECLTCAESINSTSTLHSGMQWILRWIIAFLYIHRIMMTAVNALFHRVSLMDPMNAILHMYYKDHPIPFNVALWTSSMSFVLVTLLLITTLHQLVKRAAVFLQTLCSLLPLTNVVIALCYGFLLHICAYILLFRVYIPIQYRAFTMLGTSHFPDQVDLLLQHVWNIMFTGSVFVSSCFLFMQHAAKKRHITLTRDVY